MIDTQDKNSVTIVGYKQATITQEYAWWIGQECGSVSVVEPKDLEPSDNTSYIISITKDADERLATIDKLKTKTFAKFIHSSVIRHGVSNIGQGTFIGPNASLFFDCKIGDHCIVAPYSMIGHSTTVGINSIIHPGVMIAGSCNIGKYCVFGMRSTVIDKISICDNVFIGAGSMVTKNITVPAKYVGSPARKKTF